MQMNMTELALILVSSILINNFVLTQFLGLYPSYERKCMSACK